MRCLATFRATLPVPRPTRPPRPPAGLHGRHPLSPPPGRLPTVPADPELPATLADAVAGLPDAAVTVTAAGTVTVRFPGDVVFYVTPAR